MAFIEMDFASGGGGAINFTHINSLHSTTQTQALTETIDLSKKYILMAVLELDSSRTASHIISYLINKGNVEVINDADTVSAYISVAISGTTLTISNNNSAHFYAYTLLQIS